jgi:hypothetical protein
MWVCVCVRFVLCVNFGNVCTCIDCVLYCLYCGICIVLIYVYIFLLVLSALLPSYNLIAVSNNNNINNNA